MQRHINVIDMYHGNDVKPSDFTALKAAGVYGIIHKASQGLHFRDAAYKERRKIVTDLGMLWGAYHFMDASNPDDQADFFLNCAGVEDATFSFPSLWCDFEDNPRSQAALHQCLAFMKRVDGMSPDGIACGLYSGNVIKETLRPPQGGHMAADMQGAADFFVQHRLWLAQYGPQVKIPWPWDQPISKSGDQSAPLAAPGVFMWQFTEKGRMSPLSGFTDGNFFDGTFEELQARWLA